MDLVPENGPLNPQLGDLFRGNLWWSIILGDPIFRQTHMTIAMQFRLWKDRVWLQVVSPVTFPLSLRGDGCFSQTQALDFWASTFRPDHLQNQRLLKSHRFSMDHREIGWFYMELYSWENRRSKNARNGPLPSGKPTKNYGKSPFLMGKSTISMAIFNCYVSLPEGNQVWWPKTAQLIAQQKNCGPLLSSQQRGLPSRWAGFGDLLLDIPQAIRSILTASDSQGWRCLSIDRLVNYPLVNIQKAMENHHFRRVNPL